MKDFLAPKKPLIHYVFHPHRPDERLAVFVALIHPEDGKIHIGWAQCRDGDHFSKKFGRDVATGRALKGVDPRVKPHPIKFYNPDGSYENRDVVGEQLNLFRFRALNHFSPKLCEADDVSVGELANIVFVVAQKPLPTDDYEQAKRDLYRTIYGGAAVAR